MMLGWSRYFRMLSSRSVVEGTPSSSIGVRLTASTCPVSWLTTLKTLPQAPSPSLATKTNLSRSSCSMIGVLQQLRSVASNEPTSAEATSQLLYFEYTKPAHHMKDRWKILLVTLLISLILGVIFMFVGLSFKSVGLRSYGILVYTFYDTVEPSQTIRTNGNYLVGLDYAFIEYPRGLVSHRVEVEVLTKDKSLVTIEGMFVGRLISSEVLDMHFAYGDQYFEVVRRTVDETFRTSLEVFLLKEIIEDRSAVDSYVSSSVCLAVQGQYSYMACQYAATGKLHTSASPTTLTAETSIQQHYKSVLAGTMEAQKRMNVYSGGGFEVVQRVEQANAELFRNATQLIVDTVRDYTSDGTEVFAGAQYVLDNPLMPVLSNQMKAFDGSEAQ